MLLDPSLTKTSITFFAHLSFAHTTSCLYLFLSLCAILNLHSSHSTTYSHLLRLTIAFVGYSVRIDVSIRPVRKRTIMRRTEKKIAHTDL